MKKFQSLDITFLNAQQQKLAARLELPINPDYFAIFSPCFTCTKETLASYRISQALANKNIAVLRLDFTGLGNSEGSFSDTNFSSMVDDIVAANRYLSQHYQPASLLLGHSLGGTASYAAAAQLVNIDAVVSIASPSTPTHVTHHFGKALDDLKQGSESTFSVANKTYSIKPQFIKDLESHRLDSILKTLKQANLVLHGCQDKIVDIEHGYNIFSLSSQPKSFISLDTADHILSQRQDATYSADVIHCWAKRYISNTN